MLRNISYLSLFTTCTALPGIGIKSGADDNTLLEWARPGQVRDIKDHQACGEPIDCLTNTIAGLLGSVAESVNPDNIRPQPGYEFVAPGPEDSRGLCPALNCLANYGYLPRNGYVSFGQVLNASSYAFNFAPDLTTFITIPTILTAGNITTESFWLGTDPTTHIGGLQRHSTVESDISPNREDYFLGCGDNHHLSSRLFRQNVNLAAADPTKQFTLEVMGNQYNLNADYSKQYNQYLYFLPLPSIISLGTYAFYPRFFSNGTYDAGGVANYESISSIIGASYDEDSGNFIYAPERFPENWYRRATPYTFPEILADIFTLIFPKNPTVSPISLSPDIVLCNLYQAINSVTPLALSGTEEDGAARISWALSKLDAVFNMTALGCPTGTISSDFYAPNATQPGGPLDPPPSQFSHTGNNVYNMTYFVTPPHTPHC